MSKQQYVEYLRCELTDTEIADTARDLARANSRKASIDQQKKEADAQLKAEIQAQESIIARLSALINSGHEYRNIECRVELDTPTSGRKTIVRLDTGEIVSEKPMTDADRQMVMDLQTAAEAAEEEARAKEESDKVIVTPPPVLQSLPAPEVMSAAEVEASNQTWTDGLPHSDGGSPRDTAPLASASVMGTGTHQKKGKKAAAGDK